MPGGFDPLNIQRWSNDDIYADGAVSEPASNRHDRNDVIIGRDRRDASIASDKKPSSKYRLNS